MKTITRIFATLCVLATAAACQQFDIDTQMTPEKEYANLRLVCDALTAYTVQASRPDNITFNVSSNSPWTVTRSGGSDWCTVTPSSSSSSSLVSDVEVSFADNDTGEDRSATLTVQAERISKYYSITITQSKKGRLYVTPVAKDFAASGGPLTFTINTNVPWEIHADVSWLHFDPELGNPDPDGRTMTITATADANDDEERTATVTVKAGDDEESFDVLQKGASFGLVPPANTAFAAKGGEIIIDVASTKAWEPRTDTPGFSVEKIDNTQFKVVAAPNNTFGTRKGKVSIVAGSSSDSVELTQESNFEVQNGEVLEDGSVKLSGDKGSRVTLKEGVRCMTLTLTLGEKHFGDAGQLWVQGALGGVNIYNQLSLGGNTRIRTDGNMADEAATSAYKSSSYSISKDELNAMTTYEYGFKPNAEDPKLLDMWFKVDGTEKKSHTGNNPFYYNPDKVNFYFGFYGTTSDGSWYVVKSCDIKVNEEAY